MLILARWFIPFHFPVCIYWKEDLCHVNKIRLLVGCQFLAFLGH
jgi:hypothetical protein